RRVGSDGLIATIAGTGSIFGPLGDGGPAIAARLELPSGLAFAPDGSLYIADRDDHRVRRVGIDGIITTIAGTGISTGPLGDGGLATAATLNSPRGVAVGPDGSVYISDSSHFPVRRVSPDGMIATLVGPGSPGSGGNGGPAAQASLASPGGLAVGPDGSLYIAEPDGIRRVGPDGIIQLIAGSTIGFSGDGGPATLAE